MTEPLLDIRDLVVSFRNQTGKVDVVHGFNLQLEPGETVGVVGESGSGKTMSMLALARLLPKQAFVSSGTIRMGGEDLQAITKSDFHRRISGARVAMIFQEPMTALNPVYTIGRQLTESVMALENLSRPQANARAVEMLEAVQLPNPADRLRQYPHELSGGQRQRVMIAMALMAKPDLLIADEPTTALDVTVQNEIIQLLVDLQKRFGMAMIFISHDLGVVSRVSQKIVVMCRGDIVETGETSKVLRDPQHPYTRNLLECLWRLDQPASQSAGDSEAIIQVKGLNKTYKLRSGLFGQTRWVKAVQDVSFDVRLGETLAIVGESGSGKSTVAKIVNGLAAPDTGSVTIDGKPVNALSDRDRARLIQPIFQDPYSTLNPSQTIGSIIARPLVTHGLSTKSQVRGQVIDVLEQVGLGPEFFNRFPNQLSGGQRQRVAIARAIVLKPRILICDEPTSALDVSIQEQILDLLAELKRDLNMTMLLISHDMAVVGHVADRILVMLNGKVIERGSADDVLGNPETDYTKTLMESVYRVPNPTLVTGAPL